MKMSNWQVFVLCIVGLLVGCEGFGASKTGANLKEMGTDPKGIDFEVEIPKDAPDFVGPIKLKDGKFLAVGRGSKCYLSSDGGKTWNIAGNFANIKKAPISRRPTKPQSLIRLKSGAIAINFWVKLKEWDQALGRQSCYFVKSTDEGKTWSAPVRVSWPHTPAYSTWMIQTKTGRLVISNEYYFELPLEMDSGFSLCTAYYSDDEGDTWKESKSALYFEENKGEITRSIEVPCVAETSDGRLLMFMRSHYGRIAYSYSKNGLNWSPVKFNDLVTTNAEIYLAKIPSTGDLVCIWNQASRDEVRNGFYRGRLTSAISKDSGKTWQNFRTIATSPGMKKIDRIKPLPPLFNASLYAVPKKDKISPEGFYMNTFPRVKFIGDKAYLVYNHREYKYPPNSNQFKRLYNRRKLRVFDIKWFYGKDE